MAWLDYRVEMRLRSSLPALAFLITLAAPLQSFAAQAPQLSTHPQSVNTVRNGSGAPANSVGNDGDFYIDVAGVILYGPRAGGVWPAFGIAFGGSGGSGGGGGGGCGILAPCAIAQGGTNAITASQALANLTYAPPLGSLLVTPIGETAYQSAFTIDIRSLGAMPNAPFFNNAAIIQEAVNQAAVSQVCDVTVPGAIWSVGYNINIPTCVKLHGTASFGQPSEYGGPQYGSVLEAMPGFTGPAFGPNGVSPYPSHFMLSIDGSDSLIGYPGSTVTAETDTYGAQAFNLTVDCNGVAGCSGLFAGHRNENSLFRDMIAENWSQYGYLDCGGGTGGTGPGGNTPCGPAGGDNGGGPDDRIQLVSYGAWVTAATIPAVFLQSFGRGINDWTINTSPGPIYGMYLEAGPNFYARGVHFESAHNGIWNGPTSGLCATLPVTPHCGGSKATVIENVSMNGAADGSSATGSVVINDNTTGASYKAITYNGGGTMANVFSDVHNGINVPLGTTAYLGAYEIDQLGNPQNPNYLWYLTGELYSQGSVVVESNANPQLTVQSLTSPFYASQFYEDPSGQMNINCPGSSPCNWYWSHNAATLSGAGNTAQFNGWNIQGLVGAPVQAGDAAMSVNALYGSNVYWQAGTSPVWRWGNIGGTGYAAFLGMRYGQACIATSNGSGAGGSELNSTLLAAIGLCVEPSGNTILGAGATTLTDTGQLLQVNGSAKVTGALTVGSCTGCGGAGGGSVTSVGLTGDGTLFNPSVSGSPVTTTGAFAPALLTHLANSFFAGPTSGGASAPTFRAIAAADVPVLNQATTSTAAGISGAQAVGSALLGPVSGSPATAAFRALALTDLPANINASAIGGVTVSGTPAVGYELTATSPTAANWQAGGSASLPSLTSHTNQYLTNNGSSANWGNILTGASGALDCATIPGTCDVSTIVPLKAAANVWTGANDFRSAPYLKVPAASGAPSGGCAVLPDVGQLYVRNDAGMPANSVYACDKTGSTTYAWELISSGSSAGLTTFKGQGTVNCNTSSTLTFGTVTIPAATLSLNSRVEIKTNVFTATLGGTITGGTTFPYVETTFGTAGVIPHAEYLTGSNQVYAANDVWNVAGTSSELGTGAAFAVNAPSTQVGSSTSTGLPVVNNADAAASAMIINFQLMGCAATGSGAMTAYWNVQVQR